MKLLIIFFILLLSAVSLNMAQEQPPYRISGEPAINTNFDVVYQTVDKHIHDGTDSSLLQTVLPSTGATYNLGDSTSTWKDVYVSSIVQINSGFFYAKTSSTGFVTVSENGTCYSIRIHNDGTLFTTSVTCP